MWYRSDQGQLHFEDGFAGYARTVGAWADATGVPWVTVSPVGYSAGYPKNNGATYGPDSPGTQDNGVDIAYNSGAAVIYLLAGNFYFNSGILINRAVWIKGAGRNYNGSGGTTCYAGTSGITFFETNHSLSGSSETSRILISDMCFDTGGNSGVSGVDLSFGINFAEATANSIKNCLFNGDFTVIINLNGNDEGVVEDVYCQNLYGPNTGPILWQATGPRFFRLSMFGKDSTVLISGQTACFYASSGMNIQIGSYSLNCLLLSSCNVTNQGTTTGGLIFGGTTYSSFVQMLIVDSCEMGQTNSQSIIYNPSGTYAFHVYHFSSRGTFWYNLDSSSVTWCGTAGGAIALGVNGLDWDVNSGQNIISPGTTMTNGLAFYPRPVGFNIAHITNPPAGTGTPYAVYNSLGYPVRIQVISGAAIGTHIIDVNGVDKAVADDLTQVIDPGCAIYYAVQVPAGWLWYGL